MSKKVEKPELQRPLRPADHTSKRGVPYWWQSEWCRDVNGTVGKIRPIKEKGTVNLYMESKSGNLTYIQGSIQEEFKKWHLEREIDYIILGEDPDKILEGF